MSAQLRPGRRRTTRLAAAGALLLGLALVQLVSSGPPVGAATPLHRHRPRPVGFRPRLGIGLVAPSRESTAEIRGEDRVVLRALKRQLEIDSVTLNFFLYQQGNRRGYVHPGPETMSPREVLLLGREIRRFHLSVSLRPLIRVTPCTPPRQAVQKCGWEGHISPVDQRRWFLSLYRSELPYLRVAKRLHAVSFVVATELIKLDRATRYWTWLFRKDQAVAPHMVLETAASTVAYFRHPAPRLEPDDSYAHYGLDFYPASGTEQWDIRYPHLTMRTLGPGTPIGRLAALMEHMLRATHSAALLRETTIVETGMAAVSTGYLEPAQYLFPVGERTDVKVQAHWFSAVCRTVKALHMPGVYFFPINLAENPLKWWRGPSTSFMGRDLSMRALRGCAALFGLAPRRR